jgi:hypothetical protein
MDRCSNPAPYNISITVNKQLNDKERVAAALENPVLLDTVEQCLSDKSTISLSI